MNPDDRTALAGLATEERLRAGDLIAELNSRARRIGLNSTDWPGLTMYRFEAPVVPPVERGSRPVAVRGSPGTQGMTIDGSTYCYDPFNYLVLSRGMRFEAEILEATDEKPLFSPTCSATSPACRRTSSSRAYGWSARGNCSWKVS